MLEFLFNMCIQTNIWNWPNSKQNVRRRELLGFVGCHETKRDVEKGITGTRRLFEPSLELVLLVLLEPGATAELDRRIAS